MAVYKEMHIHIAPNNIGNTIAMQRLSAVGLSDEASLFTFKILPSFSPHPEQSRVERSSYIYGTRPNALFIKGGRGSNNLGVHFMAIRVVEFSNGGYKIRKILA